MTEEKTDWFKEFLNRQDMALKNHVFVGNVEDEFQYTLKQFCLWTLKDKLDIMNDDEIVRLTDGEMCFADKFDKKLSFTKLHHFFKSLKQYIWNE